jgi:signal transduction histidine kinase
MRDPAAAAVVSAMSIRSWSRLRTSLWAAGGLVAIGLSFWLDRVTPDQFSFEILYVVATLAVTIRAGRNAGALVGAAGAIAYTADTMLDEGFGSATVTWNLLTRLLMFVGVALMVDLYNRRGVRLAELDRHREDSFALVAHKLRQTAKRIASVTGAIAARPVDGIVTEARIALDHQARELQRMAEDVLDVNVLEARRFRMDVSSVDLGELVTDVAREIGRGQVQLVLQAEPVIVEGDADRLRTMISHLIANAVRYSPAAAPIVATVAGGAAEARIVVQDQGVGLGPSDVTVLFQKYGQPRSAKPSGVQGVGLGLYVTRLLAEAHGGRVTAESRGPGQGATFQLSLPVRQPSATAR